MLKRAQLTYTLTRPDVYNAIMAIPGYSQEFEAELGVDKSKGMDSNDYMVTYEAITIDSRFFWRARTKSGGFYWKTFDIFTQPQQSAEEVIFSLPNGLQGYALFGALNQLRVDVFTNIVRDPRLQRYVADRTSDKLSGF